MRLLLMYSLAPPGADHLQRLRALSPDLEVVVADGEQQAMELAEEAEVIFGHRFLRQCLPRTKRLRWVQTSAQGVDRLPLDDLFRRGILLTRNTQDAVVVAAHALALAWALTRALPQAIRCQDAGCWDPHLPFAPLPRRALVMGVGPIGRAIAQRLRSDGIDVICAGRTKDRERTAVPCSELVVGDSWRDCLPHCDWCFLALPHTLATVGLFDGAAMRALPRGAVVVNVGRGSSLDTAALTRLLESGHLGGAGLDVVGQEPLPADDPLWRVPRLLITPHVASHHPGRIDRLERFFERQMRAYLAGEPLADRVDMEELLQQPGGDGDV